MSFSITLLRKLCRLKSKYADQHIGRDCNLKFDQEENHLYIAFTGTNSNQDRNDSYNIKLVEFKQVNGRPLVHKGFRNNYLRLRDDLMDLVDQYGYLRKITVVGYSLGGALAQLCALELASNGQLVDCHTFASPKVGSFKFRRLFNSRVNKADRWIQGSDRVPYFPPFPYQHVGRLHWNDPELPDLFDDEDSDHEL